MTDLKDVTLLIPLRVDSEERVSNLDALLEYLCRGAELQVLIMEADEVPRYFPKKKYPHVGYWFVKDTDPVFYRTYYLNRLLEKVQTPFAGIWDTDVIVSFRQIADAVSALRKGEAVMSIPYDGRVYAVPPLYSKEFRQSLDFDFLDRHISDSVLLLGNLSVGGAILVNKETYWKAGGENEHFYGWGPEDFERVKRMEKLHLPVYRSPGPLFHLYHPVGINSQYASQALERRNQAELFAIDKMDREALLDDIRTWRDPGEVLQRIADYLLAHAYSSQDIGLFYGVAGWILFFFHYARYSKKTYYEDFAGDLLDFLYARLDPELSLSFESGLCGIGWAMEYLVQSGFMRGDTSLLLREFDEKVMEWDPAKIKDLSLETGLLGIFQYVEARARSARQNNKPFPFDSVYYSKLRERAACNEWEIPQGVRPVLDDLLNKVRMERNTREWKSGLKEGCAGYGLKLLLT